MFWDYLALLISSLLVSPPWWLRYAPTVEAFRKMLEAINVAQSTEVQWAD